MASLHQIEKALLDQVKSAIPARLPVRLASGQLNLIETRIAIGWPPINVLQDVGRGTLAAISIYDRNIVRNSTRWNPLTLSEIVTPATLQSAVAPSVIPALGSGTITLSNTPTNGDAVSAVIKNSGTAPASYGAQVVSAAAGDTPSTMAT